LLCAAQPYTSDQIISIHESLQMRDGLMGQRREMSLVLLERFVEKRIMSLDEICAVVHGRDPVVGCAHVLTILEVKQSDIQGPLQILKAHKIE